MDRQYSGQKKKDKSREITLQLPIYSFTSPEYENKTPAIKILLML